MASRFGGQTDGNESACGLNDGSGQVDDNTVLPVHNQTSPRKFTVGADLINTMTQNPMRITFPGIHLSTKTLQSLCGAFHLCDNPRRINQAFIVYNAHLCSVPPIRIRNSTTKQQCMLTTQTRPPISPRL